MNELIMPHNVGVKNALENMKEVLALYKNVIGCYRPLLDGERYLTDREVAQILKVSTRIQKYHERRRDCHPRTHGLRRLSVRPQSRTPFPYSWG